MKIPAVLPAVHWSQCLAVVLLGCAAWSAPAAETVYQRTEKDGAIELTNVPEAGDYEVAVTGSAAATLPPPPPLREETPAPLSRRALERRRNQDESAQPAPVASVPEANGASGAGERTAADEASDSAPTSGNARLQELYNARGALRPPAH